MLCERYTVEMAWRYTIEASRLASRLVRRILWRSVLFFRADHGLFNRSLHFLFAKLKRPTGIARLLTMQGKHTWTALERQRATDFANSLPEGRLESARAKARLPSASVDELVRSFSDDREQLSRLQFVFDVTKPDLVRFFRQLKPSTDVLSMTTLNGKKKEDLCAWFEAYLSQVCRVSEFCYNLSFNSSLSLEVVIWCRDHTHSHNSATCQMQFCCAKQLVFQVKLLA